MLYSISETSLQTRKNNIFLGALFSLVLAAIITAGHFKYPEIYNDMVFWSVIIVVVVGNLANYYRYRRYLRLVEDHRIEVDSDEVSFFTGTEKSVLDTKNELNSYGGTRLWVTPLSSKLMTLAAGLACFEMRPATLDASYVVGIPYAEPRRYIAEASKIRATKPDLSVLLLTGSAYSHE